MARSIDCHFCQQEARLVDGQFWCVNCGFIEESIPRDRVHYFEDEDIFPSERDDDDRGLDYIEDWEECD